MNFLRLKIMRLCGFYNLFNDMTCLQEEMGRLRARIEKLEDADNERKIYGKHT